MASDEPLPRPVEMRRSSVNFDHTSDTIKVITMHASKGLEFPVVALPGVDPMSAKGEDEQEAARVLYVAATRATQRLVFGVGVMGGRKALVRSPSIPYVRSTIPGTQKGTE